MPSFDRAHMTSYMRSIGLSRTISKINGDFGQKSQIFPTPCICAPTEVGIGIGYRRRGTIFTFVAFCYKHDICISRIVTQNTLKCTISRAKFQTPHPLVAFDHSPPRPLSRNPGSATADNLTRTSKKQNAQMSQYNTT